MDTNYSLADIAAATGGNKNNDGFGDGNGWWIILFFLCMFGWGGFGGFGGNGTGTNGAGFQGWATRADINEGFALNDIQNGIRGIQQGQCDSTYALNNTIQNGFNNTNTAMLQGFNGLQAQVASCCCDTREAIQGVRYDMATQSCATNNLIQNVARDITDNANANTRSILDFLVNDKIATLTAENQGLKFQASQTAQNAYLAAMSDAQTAELVRRINPTPVPSYTVPAPYPYGGCNGYNASACC